MFFYWLKNSPHFITRILYDFFAFLFYRDTAYQLLITFSFVRYLPSKYGCNSSDLTDIIILRQQQSPSTEFVKRSFSDHHPWIFVSLHDAAILMGRFSANSIWHSVCQLTTFCSKLSGISWCISVATRLLYSPNRVAVGWRMLVLTHVYVIGQSKYRSGKSKIAMGFR